MAKGRMLNHSISRSAKFQALPDDTCRLLATWTIPQLDTNGVFHGEPALIKSLIFPYRSDVTTEQVREYLKAMQHAGLIVLFEARGQLWQVWPGFDHNQPYLRKDREGKSEHPAPPTDLAAASLPLPDSLPIHSGVNPPNRREEKGKEENGKEGTTFTPPPSADVADSTGQIIATEEARNSEAVRLWRKKLRRPLSPEATNAIYETATDTGKLEAVIDYWLIQGWANENVNGILSMYRGWDTDRRNPKNQKSQPAASRQSAPVSYFGEGGTLDRAMQAVWGDMGASDGN